ncbi:hypothetical protein [Amycolatopsis sp. NPDC051061]|uniref:hypothetical protein n=1 Tax=Amycolatopsis sp. NPDC051061 TaxID=3155042 RepID=UPI003443DD61
MTITCPAPPSARAASAVLFSDDVLRKFLDAAVAEYAHITPDEPRPCFGALLGTVVGETVLVSDVAFGRNVRTTDPAAREEFATAIVPRFGAAYENPVRAWWFAPADLLGIARGAEERGLDVLGSIHLHPDWHRLGPESERECRLSDRPTPMDEYVFRSTGWPLNVVCYLEKQHGGFYYSLAAWDPECVALPLRVHAPMERENR